MIGLGTIFNVLLIIIGGLLGKYFGKYLSTSLEEGLKKMCGVGSFFLGLSGVILKMIYIENNSLEVYGTFMMVISLIVGYFIGELLKIEDRIERFGGFIKIKTGNGEDNKFVEGFLIATLTVCIGAMSIVGAIEDGINGNYSILLIKGILDCIIVLAMSASYGIGPLFSFIPVLILEGLITVLAIFLEPVFTDLVIKNISLVGNILICLVGVNLFFGKKVKVANALPSLIIASLLTLIPFFNK